MDGDFTGEARRGPYVLGGRDSRQQLAQVEQVRWELPSRRRSMAQQPHGLRVTGRSAPDAQVDATGVESVEGAELLGDHEGRVIRQHHPTRSQPDRARARGHRRDDHWWRGGADHRLPVVLGVPHTPVPRRLRGESEIDGVAQGRGDRLAPCYRYVVEDGERMIHRLLVTE